MEPDKRQAEVKCDSQEEVYTVWWLEELRVHGYISHYNRAETFILSPKQTTLKIIELKTKQKEVPVEILSPHNYTPDFKVWWTKKAVGVFITDKLYGDLLFSIPQNEFFLTYLEVKPVFDQNNMTRLFKINQKWLYHQYGIFVNLIIPVKLFLKTFTPGRFFFTNKTNKLRKLDGSYRSLIDYVAGDKVPTSCRK